MAELEKRYRDRITGYEGVATGRSEYLESTPQVRLTRIDKNEKVEDEWFPEGRLVPVDSGDSGFGFKAPPAGP